MQSDRQCRLLGRPHDPRGQGIERKGNETVNDNEKIKQPTTCKKIDQTAKPEIKSVTQTKQNK